LLIARPPQAAFASPVNVRRNAEATKVDIFTSSVPSVSDFRAVQIRHTLDAKPTCRMAAAVPQDFRVIIVRLVSVLA
jgi:hypothetical protein